MIKILLLIIYVRKKKLIINNPIIIENIIFKFTKYLKKIIPLVD